MLDLCRCVTFWTIVNRDSFRWEEDVRARPHDSVQVLCLTQLFRDGFEGIAANAVKTLRTGRPSSGIVPKPCP